MKSSTIAARAARPRHGFVRLAIAAGVLAGCGAASADDADRIDTPPPLAVIARDLKPLVKSAAATAEAATPASVAAAYGLPAIAPHEAKLELDIDLTTSKIWNPATGVYDTVKLRSYRGTDTNPEVPFVAPTIQIQPGETVRITLDNKLEKEPNCKPPNINTPHCFNSTNLHSHGLWVSPTGNSDNVLLTIRPGVTFQYEYNIPADHPAGTFWYHPHLHGSTALQVGSGMAGTMIVRGSRLPEPKKNGDLDTLLARNPDGTPLMERIVEFQQIQYACRNKADNTIKVKKNADGKVIAWVCDPGDTGEVTGYDQFKPSSWSESGRYTSINGRVLPTFPGGKAGAIERWRTVHAGVRSTITLQFKKLKAGAPSFDRLAAADADAWAGANCVGDPLPQFEVASDGLTHTQAIQKSQNTLQPGYRSDVLVVFPEPGEYCVIDTAAPPSATINAIPESRQMLGKVQVGPGTNVSGDVKKYLIDQLSVLAERSQRPDMRGKVKGDIANDLHFDAFVPHPTITDGELSPLPPGKENAQDVVFKIADGKFTVNDKEYNPNDARTLILGRVEQWMVTSAAFNHPFHIHVNPFEIYKILNKDGVDVSVTGEPDDPQYANTKGTWKDTMWIKEGYKVYVRTRYERYIGEYVLHCHILDHEDQGMMQNVKVVLPDGEGGGIYGHH